MRLRQAKKIVGNSFRRPEAYRRGVVRAAFRKLKNRRPEHHIVVLVSHDVPAAFSAISRAASAVVDAFSKMEDKLLVVRESVRVESRNG